MRDGIRIAVAAIALCALPAATANGQTTFRETGSVTVGSALVWVRGTNTGVVQLFVGHGFHDAFARPHEVSAATLARWIDSVRAVAPARDSAVAEAQMRASVLSADVTMMRRSGGPLSGLRVLISGEEPIAIPEPTVSDFLVVLDSAAKVAVELSTPASAPAPPAAPAATVAVAAASAPPPTPTPAPPPAPTPAPPEATITQPEPELVLPAPSAPVILLASRVEIVPLPAIVPAPAPMPERPTTVAPPAAEPPAAEPPAPVAAVAAPDTVVAPPHVAAPADKLIHTPLGPFTIPGALLADRDKETQYCYTQLGLKYNPDLKGEITVKLTVAGDGTVQDAVVTKRSWQGISAGEVEACVRALAHDWTFAPTDSAVASGATLLTFSFAP